MATDQLRQLESLMNRLDQDRAASQQPADISSRTPNTVSTKFNAADSIERQLHADGHRVWGFVVYRCAYASDSDWETCIQRIKASIRKAMGMYNGHDLLEEGRFRLTVIEDANALDGASTQVVRQHFTEWCSRALNEEQGSNEEIESRRQEAEPWYGSLALRYRFCVQVDEASLQSIVSAETAGEGWVKLIKGAWKARASRASEAETQQQEPETDGLVEDQGDYEEYEEDEEHPAIEGCTEEDVGWMKVQYQSVIPDFYVNLRDPNAWIGDYRRPPDIATA